MNTSEGSLSQEEREALIRLLHDSGKEFLDLTATVTDSQWSLKRAPDSWSVQQAAEHLVLGEEAMLGRIMQALADPAVPDWQAEDARKTKFLSRVVPDRSRKAIAPAPLEPHHQWNREETLARYQKGRARTLKFAEEVDLPVKTHASEHPFPVFNMLNVYQWLLYIPLHNLRHNQQIAEALKDPTR